jgi:Tol biopolymer transport system component
MNADGSGVTRLTDQLGYDGGAFFSWDGRSIVYRASHPETAAEREEYVALLRQGLVRPRKLEVFVMRADGTGVRQVTRAGGASFAPFMHPNGQQIIFSSNFEDPTGRAFALYLINVDGSGLERVTWGESFASFPMFSRDGRSWSSGTRTRRGATSTSSSPTGSAEATPKSTSTPHPVAAALQPGKNFGAPTGTDQRAHESPQARS